MKLTGSQIRTIMEWCEGSNILNEATVNPQKILNSAAAQATNLAKKATMAYLHKAWTDAGSPTDSNEIAKVLKGAGVKAGVVSSVYQTLKIDPAKATTSSGTSDTIPFDGEQQLTVQQINQMISKLRTRDAQSLLKHVSSLVKGAAGKPATGGAAGKPATPEKAQSAQPKGRVEPKVGNIENIDADDTPKSGISAADTNVAPVKGINAQRGKQTRTPKAVEPKVGNVEPTVSEPSKKTQPKEKAALTQPRGKGEKAALLQPGRIATPPEKVEKPAVLKPRRAKPSV